MRSLSGNATTPKESAAYICMISAVLSTVLILLASVSAAKAQSLDSRIHAPPSAEFHFARLVYNSAIGSRRSGAWSTDYTDAEYHLMKGINRLTRIDGQLVEYSGEGGRLIRLIDDTIFDYPWLYAASTLSGVGFLWSMTSGVSRSGRCFWTPCVVFFRIVRL